MPQQDQVIDFKDPLLQADTINKCLIIQQALVLSILKKPMKSSKKRFRKSKQNFTRASAKMKVKVNFKPAVII